MDNQEMQIIQAKQAAEFALTPVGQTVKQFEVMQRMGKMYAESTIVPDIYRENIGNCIIAVDMAMRMNVNPLMVMQNLNIIKGTPRWGSAFLISTINMCGKFTSLKYRERNLGKVGKIKYNETRYDPVLKKNTIVELEFDGTNIDNYECIAYATELSTGEILESNPVSIETAIKEGWYTKSGSKWRTMAKLMLRYRAAAWWSRVYSPEISMGFLTKEEAEDTVGAEYVDLTNKDKLSMMAEQAVEEAKPAKTKISDKTKEGNLL